MKWLKYRLRKRDDRIVPNRHYSGHYKDTWKRDLEKDLWTEGLRQATVEEDIGRQSWMEPCGLPVTAVKKSTRLIHSYERWAWS